MFTTLFEKQGQKTWESIIYPKDPQITPYGVVYRISKHGVLTQVILRHMALVKLVKNNLFKPPGNFKILSRQNKMALSGLFLNEWQTVLDFYYFFFKSAQV